jgi:hypothetical protein
MRRILAGVVILALAWPALADDDKPKDKEKKKTITVPATLVITGGQDDKSAPAAKPGTPAGKYQALVLEFNNAQQEFFKEYRAAKTNDEREKILREKQPKAEDYAAKFMKLAEENPKDAATVDALIWVAQRVRSNAKDSPKAKAVALLLRDHVDSPRLGPLCQILAFDFQEKEAESLLRGVLAKSSSDEVKSEACLALAQLLGQKASFAKRLNDPGTKKEILSNGTAAQSFAQQIERSYGRDLVAELKKTDSSKLAADSDELFKTFADKYMAHMQPDSLKMVVQRLSFSNDKGAERIMRRLADDDSSAIKPEMRGQACMALAGMLKRQAEGLPDADAKQAAELNKQSEDLCERVIQKYGDVKSSRGALGEQAKKQLFELRFLARGKTAPEVEAEDLDGKQFKLSDYRGKVVLLDFWGNW